MVRRKLAKLTIKGELAKEEVLRKLLLIAQEKWFHPLDCLKAEISTDKRTARLWYDRCPDAEYAVAICKEAGEIAKSEGFEAEADVYDKPDPIIIRPKVATISVRRK
jgi:hypothetical protein